MITVSNPEVTLFLSDINGVVDDVICEPEPIITPLNDEETIVGIEPVPLPIILITLANEDDTIVLSELITLLDDVI